MANRFLNNNVLNQLLSMNLIDCKIREYNKTERNVRMPEKNIES